MSITAKETTRPIASTWYVYLLQTSTKQLYTGITTDPLRRLRQHSGVVKGGAKSLRGKQPLILKCLIKTQHRSQALQLELRIKSLTRQQKHALLCEGLAHQALQDLLAQDTTDDQSNTDA